MVIGGPPLSGGRGAIYGPVPGRLNIGVLNNSLFLLEVSPFWQQAVKGFVILARTSWVRAGNENKFQTPASKFISLFVFSIWAVIFQATPPVSMIEPVQGQLRSWGARPPRAWLAAPARPAGGA